MSVTVHTQAELACCRCGEMTRQLIVCDVETTGLDPARHLRRKLAEQAIEIRYWRDEYTRARMQNEWERMTP